MALLSGRMRAAFAAVLLVTGTATAADPDFAARFAGRDGCFVLYDLTADKVVARFNPRRCEERVSPCSTFKVPLALMAFDAGILANETTELKWDGTKTSREVWNRDHTAASWMRDSVVWFSKRLTAQLGTSKVKTYLAEFDYGNRDMSGGLTRAWLESSLKISPDEQLRFWRSFWREQLPVSEHAYAMTKRITLVATSPAGWTLHGKTGSGGSIGWFAGHVARGGREYVFVSSFTDGNEAGSDDHPRGWIARDIAIEILGELELY